MIELNLPWVESPFFYEIIKNKNLSPEQVELATTYHENGYVVLPNFFSADLIDKVQKDAEEKGFNPNFPVKTQRDTHRIQDMWLISEACQKLASQASLLNILEMLYDRAPIPFQTLNFCRGSEQRAHSDTIHFSSLPARYMCGVWVALEDVTPENGALFYYPASHKLPEYNFSHFRKDIQTPSYENYVEYEDFIEQIVNHYGFEKKCFYAKKGDALIWSSNIIHGGSRVTKEGSSRWSQVTHYFFEDTLYYTPMLSNMVTNELYIRDKLVNIATGNVVKHSYNKQKVNPIPTKNSRYLLSSAVSAQKIPKILRFLGKCIVR